MITDGGRLDGARIGHLWRVHEVRVVLCSLVSFMVLNGAHTARKHQSQNWPWRLGDGKSCTKASEPPKSRPHGFRCSQCSSAIKQEASSTSGFRQKGAFAMV